VTACTHPGLFTSDAPAYGTAAYAAWLDSTRRCGSCGSDVAERDL
jgi:hypothetical protein